MTGTSLGEHRGGRVRWLPLAIIAVALLLCALLVMWWPISPSESPAPIKPSSAEPAEPAPALPERRDENARTLAPDAEALTAATAAPAAASPDGAAPTTADEPLLLRVVIVDRAATPIPDASVRIWDDEGSLEAGQPAVFEAMSNGVGRATVSMPTGLSVLVAERQGVGSSGIWTRVSVASSANLDGETAIALHPTSHMTGLVLRADDRPAAGVRVHFYLFGGGAAGDARTPPETQTDHQGHFAIEVDAGAPLAMRAHEGERQTPEERFWLKDGEDRDVVLRFPGDWWIAGTTRDAAGSVVAKVQVRLWLEFPGYDIEGGQFPEANCYGDDARSDDEGRFRFAVPRLAGYTLLASVEGRPASDALSVQLDALHPQATVTLTLPDPSFIAGRLLSEDGAGLPGVTITAAPGGSYSPVAALYAPQRVERFGHADAVTDEQGRFRLEPLHPSGVYGLSCRPDPAHPKRVLRRADVPAGTQLDWIARESDMVRGVVMGRVLSGETGDPVSEFNLELVERVGEDGFLSRWVPSPPDAEGRFRVEGLRIGTVYGLLVHSPEWATAEVTWWTSSEDGHDVVVRLEREGTLEVETRDAGGGVASLTEVRLESRREVLSNGWTAFQRTDDAGVARFVSLDPGPFHLMASRGSLRAEADLVVASGTVTRARLDLRQP